MRPMAVQVNAMGSPALTVGSDPLPDPNIQVFVTASYFTRIKIRFSHRCVSFPVAAERGATSGAR